MNKTITLPSGATATLRDPKTLKAKDRKRVYELANEETGIVQAVTMMEAVIAVIVESWTLELILPSIRFQSIGELSLNDYDRLVEEATEAQKILFANYNSDEGADSPLDKSGDTLLP